MMIAWDVVHRPWVEDIRYHQTATYVQEHLKHSSPAECSLFQALDMRMPQHRSGPGSSHFHLLAGESGQDH
eukprot:12928412-Prorocentrum_lima.AAC.1